VVAVDTNVLVRLLTGADPPQYKASVALFSTEQIFIPVTVLLESEWVLRAAFGLSPEEVSDAFKRILGLPNVAVTDAARLARAITWHQQGLDFADALHLALCQGHESLKTFDTAFIKRAKSLTESRVEKP
jgi:predicted nucleic acid-binding protein